MNLKELREGVFHFCPETVCQHTGISLHRLESIENGDAPDIAEIESLATIYGIPSDILSELPIQLSPDFNVQILARRNEYQEWNEHIRYRIVQISSAARSLANLRGMVPPQGNLHDIESKLPPLPRLLGSDQPWRQGRELANAFRRHFNLGESPIISVRDLVLNFGSISLLYCKLGENGPAGLTFASSQQGVVLALNIDGRNTNPTARRVSLAHELCHVWADWKRTEPLATVSRYPNQQQLEVEQRANAFAIRLLCPESVIKRHLDESKNPEKTTEFLINQFGLPYSAVRNYLSHTCSVSIPERPLRNIGTEQSWEKREALEGVLHFPIPEVSLERRTLVARHAAHLYAEGRIPRDCFAEMLGVPPSKHLESILNFFDIAPPDIQ
ncbi:MAG: ImmA/IrrE family metallo-endopeptidase [Magnetococcus sp. YQC-5]